jgi:hypothetical protein
MQQQARAARAYWWWQPLPHTCAHWDTPLRGNSDDDKRVTLPDLDVISAEVFSRPTPTCLRHMASRLHLPFQLRKRCSIAP